MSADALNKTWDKWHTELEQATKDKRVTEWRTRAKKIIKRYRDERGDISGDGYEVNTGARFNILWSNVQTLLPALFAKAPKPVVERRYLDRDDVGRTASVILERNLLYELESGSYASAIRKAVLDRLLPGRGVVWVRYEPRFTAMPGKTQEAADSEQQETAPGQEEPNDADGPDRPGDNGIISGSGPVVSEPGASAAPAPVEEQVASESVPVDYINWDDFFTSPSRIWEEVWWIAKRVYMTRGELVRRFGPVGKEVPLDWSTTETSSPKDTGTENEAGKGQRRARVIELWDKTARKVFWFAEKWPDQMLDEQDDPLQLEDFWPIPKPLFATLTNDTLVPVPDYVEYQDQAEELDDLTRRIAKLTQAIKVAGVYDASVEELQRMFSEGFENQLVPCDNMAEFTSKAGANGMGHVWLLPIQEMAETLIQLYDAREKVKQTLYEITGISDIVRGESQAGGAKTATEQRIKGQFASMRLNDLQSEVARFCRDVLRVMGELIAEHYDPQTLRLISGYDQYAKEQWPAESFAPPPQPPPSPMMGHNGGPPMGGPAGPPQSAPGALPVRPLPGTPPGAGAQMLETNPALPMGGSPLTMPQPDPMALAQQAAQAKAEQMFVQAVALLRNDKLRGFRIDIETDSTIEPDQQATQQSRTELLSAISQFLPQAIEAGQALPEIRPLLSRLLMFFLRGFKASRDIESAFEQFTDNLQKEAANPQPKPPSPEEIKAQAELQKMQMQAQQAQQQLAMDQQRGQMDLDIARQKNEMDMARMSAELEIKKQELALDQQRLAMEHQAMLAKAAVDERTTAIKANAAERTASMEMAGAERKHELGLEVMEAKASAAKKGAKDGGAK